MNAEMGEWRSATFRPQWIKCAERMPEDGVPVLVYGPSERSLANYGGPSHLSAVALIDDCGDWDIQGVQGWVYATAVIPTHWQALPPPPENDNG
jgi:hypothetical protein